jgi:hypothetical protein
MTTPPDESKPAMDRSPKAVISELLARDVTPVLKRHGFAGRGRNYRRSRPGRQELITVEQHRWSTRHGGAFTIHLGIFLDGLAAALSPAPPPEPPDEHECHIRTGRDWWTFDAGTDLAALGTEVRDWVQGHALGHFDTMTTDPGLLAWLRGTPLPPGTSGLRHVYLAATAGAPDLAQRWLDGIAAATTDPGPERRETARFAALLGLACPAPTDVPSLIVRLRVAPAQDRDDAVRHLAFKLDQHLRELRLSRPDERTTPPYHTLTCDGPACTAEFYGADAEALLRPLRRAFAKLSTQFTDITITVPGQSDEPPR